MRDIRASQAYSLSDLYEDLCDTRAREGLISAFSSVSKISQTASTKCSQSCKPEIYPIARGSTKAAQVLQNTNNLVLYNTVPVLQDQGATLESRWTILPRLNGRLIISLL